MKKLAAAATGTKFKKVLPARRLGAAATRPTWEAHARARLQDAGFFSDIVEGFAESSTVKKLGKASNVKSGLKQVRSGRRSSTHAPAA